MNIRAARCVVAIPVKNEADRIKDCLEALNDQAGRRLDGIVLLLNDCTDGSAAVARQVKLHPATVLHAIERTMLPGQASAGYARRMAMAEAARLAGPDGVVLTTDADGIVDPDWLAATLDGLAAGADVVAGWVDLHPTEWGGIPVALHEDDARECAYDRLCDEMHGLLDPDPGDPLPRHTQHSGASIAVTAAAFARCGGVPPVKTGEDRALVAALRRVDARVRHAPEVHVSVSGRTEGRSDGGMADTIKRRLVQPDAFLDDRLEPALACARRARARAGLRRVWAGQENAVATAGLLGLTAGTVAGLCRVRYFGEAWEAAEQASPALRRQPVALSDLATQMETAESILATLRPAQPADGRAGMTPSETAMMAKG